jgi:putative transposase
MERVRLYPSPSQERRLRFMLHQTRHLYNALLDQRRYAWIARRQSISSKAQYAELTALRRDDAGIASVYRECQDAVLHRLDLAMQAFFRRVKRGETPGAPRFKPASRWRQLEFPHGDRALRLNDAQTKVRIPGVGTVRLRKGRSISEFGRAFVLEKNGHWHAVFECDRPLEPLAATGNAVGIDRGVRVLAATSDGDLIENLRPRGRNRELVAIHQRDVDARTSKDSRGRVLNRRDPGRMMAVLRLARAREREAHERRDCLHKVSRKIVDRYDFIAVEDLRLPSMTRSAKGTVDEPGENVAAKAGLNRALLDAGLGMLLTLIREKAERAVRVVVSVDPRFTSQTCAACGFRAAENRDGERFACSRCGHHDHADVNAARVILSRAVQLAPTSGLSPGSTRLTQHDAA